MYHDLFVATGTRSTSKGIAYYDITQGSNEPGTIYLRLSVKGHIISGNADTTAWQVYTCPLQDTAHKNSTV